MVKRMLVDATHPEETRVVILNGTRLDEFDFETSTKKQLKGNIYLAKVTRVEPSLQAAFVEFGGNRHGFLAFSEIHPDYYQIPVADRMALLAEHARDLKHSSEVEEAVHESHGDGVPHAIMVEQPWQPETISGEPVAVPDENAALAHEPSQLPDQPILDAGYVADERLHGDHRPAEAAAEPTVTSETVEAAPFDAPASDASPSDIAGLPTEIGATDVGAMEQPEIPAPGNDAPPARPRSQYEEVGGGDEDDTQEAMAERRKARTHRHRYKIQEVIKRRQILLVQVVKEERGTKGAALTTYLSLAGRYCVWMPNTVRGGGVSRRIPSTGDRKRLKECLEEMDIPEGMAVILRTAAVERSKAEIKRDFEYLLRQWDSVRELTLQSVAPTLVYEEASLIKRAIRDLYLKDIDEILVEGEDGYRMAKEFMRLLMPSHAKKVQLYNDPEIPLYHRYQVESQLDAMHSPTVNLKSGGYIVINPTEALVAIDVNSGRATRERNIEETAYKTNLEAAEEIARQLRLRDLGGLIVIDFIDMEDHRNVHTVEKRVKEAMKVDRARIQIGRISPFGLLELSRQRLRPSLLEASTERCPHCAGSGMIRSTESTALHVLRSVEEEGIRHRTAELLLTLPETVAMYILNQMRARLNEIEVRYGFAVRVNVDASLIPPAFKLERTKTRDLPPPGSERHVPIMAGANVGTSDGSPTPAQIDEAVDEVMEPRDVEEEIIPERVETAREDGDTEDGRRRRRRRGRRGERGERGENVRSEGFLGEPREESPRAEGRNDRPRGDDQRGERPPRRDYPRDDAFPLTPAAVGAMLDGRPVSTLDDDDGDSVGNGDPAPASTRGPADDRGHGEELGPDGQPRRRRRRGRRGGRRRRRPGWDETQNSDGQTAHEGQQPDVREPHSHSHDHVREPSHVSPEAIERRAEPDQIVSERPISERSDADRSKASPQAHEPRRDNAPPPPPSTTDQPADPNQPARKGWWQRFTS
jgi:ribonuclease E